mmetsp:Transcript_148214/g.273521  ORF Transcript_148214/g.273521 Transcript_148214/m.273521 type:complete len:102 (-) Transcript_148214:577-882(-)
MPFQSSGHTHRLRITEAAKAEQEKKLAQGAFDPLQHSDHTARNYVSTAINCIETQKKALESLHVRQASKDFFKVRFTVRFCLHVQIKKNNVHQLLKATRQH